jgi:hypothetical protein
MHVTRDHAQHVIDLAGDGGALHHLRPMRDRSLELLQIIARRQLQLHRGEHLEIEPELLVVEQRNLPQNHPRALQPFDPAPCRR